MMDVQSITETQFAASHPCGAVCVLSRDLREFGGAGCKGTSSRPRLTVADSVADLSQAKAYPFRAVSGHTPSLSCSWAHVVLFAELFFRVIGLIVHVVLAIRRRNTPLVAGQDN